METLYDLYNSLLQHSSYPTYEEWKHREGVRQDVGTEGVLILPMRNGNIYYFLLNLL